MKSQAKLDSMPEISSEKEIIVQQNRGKKALKKNHSTPIEPKSQLSTILDSGRLQTRFTNLSLIGQGGFGKVYRATYAIDQKVYAIKKVQLKIPYMCSDPVSAIFSHHVYREL